jgi:ABC-type uncharacterized transport system involved in gliding motility auxiliary subunit
MDKIKKNLNVIGLGLAFAGLAALRIWPQTKIAGLVLVVVGVGAIAAYLGLNAGQLKQGMKRRSFLYSSNAILLVALVLGILVLVNVFFSRHHHRFDFTESKLHSLSDPSIKVAAALKTDISVKAFFREGNPARGRMEDLLKIYTYHTPRIKYEFIDPDKNPGLIKRYEITQDGTTIFESGDKDNRITATTEEDVTNALIKVTRERKKIIYFLEGHGEKSTEVTDETGFSFMKDDLTKMGYEVKKQLTALPEAFPKDCALLVVPGPVKDFAPNEFDAIRSYLENGGRVFFMVDPLSAPGLVPYLAKLGIKLDIDTVIDRPTLFGGDYLMPMMSEIASHEITKNFRYVTYYPLARSVDVIDPKPEGVTTSQVLGKTSENAYTKKSFVLKKGMTVKDIAFDAKTDKKGPIPLAAIATLKPKTSSEPGKTVPEGRLAVFGDSDFASNRYSGEGGNGNLFLNVANWLTEESDLISISPKTSSPRGLQLTPTQGKLIFWVSVVFMPLLVLALGISIWLRRRAL